MLSPAQIVTEHGLAEALLDLVTVGATLGEDLARVGHLDVVHS